VTDGCPSVGRIVILTSLNRYPLGNLPVRGVESQGIFVDRQARVACQVERDGDTGLRARGQCHIVVGAAAVPFIDGKTGWRDDCSAAVGIVVSNVDCDANGGTAIGRGWGIGDPGLPGCRTRLFFRKDLNGLIPVPVGDSEGE